MLALKVALGVTKAGFERLLYVTQMLVLKVALGVTKADFERLP